MRRFATLVWVDATSGVPLIFGVMVALTNVLIVGAVGGRHLYPGPGDPLNLLLTIATFTAPVALGGAAAHAGHLRRAGVTRWAATTTRGWLAPVVVGAVASLCWVLVAQGLGLGLVLTHVTPNGRFSLWMLLPGVSAFLLPASASLAGSAIGVRLPSGLTAPALALSLCASIYAFSYAQGRWRFLSPVYPEVRFSSPVFEPNHLLLMGQMSVMLAVASLSYATLLRAPWLFVAATVGVLFSVGAAGLLSRAPEDLIQFPHEQPVCASRNGFQVCVWPEYEAGLSRDLQVITDLARAMYPEVTPPRNYRLVGLTQPSNAVEYGGSYAPDDTQRRSAALQAMLPTARCSTNTKADVAAVDLSDWVLSRAGHPDPHAETLSYTSWNPTRTHVWVKAQLRTLNASC